MDQRVYDLLRDCTVRIVVARRTGTGSFVAPGRVLTCAHVVQAAQADGSPIEVHWNNCKYAAEILGFYPPPYPDLAILYVNVEKHPCLFLDEGALPFDQLYCYGYTDEYPNGDSTTVECEGWTAGDQLPSGANQLLLKLKAGQVRPGASGAPLLNLRTGAVCGIVKSSRDRSSDLGGRGIPTAAIFAQAPDLISLQEQFHQEDGRWTEYMARFVSRQIRQPGDYVPFPVRDILFILHVESSVAWEARLVQELFARANLLHERTYAVRTKLEIVPQGNAASLNRFLSARSAFVLSIIQSRLLETDFNILAKQLNMKSVTKEGAQLLLLFNGSSMVDIRKINLEHLARIKQIHEMAERSGVAYYDYASEAEFRRILWYWLWKTVESSADLGISPKVDPEQQAPQRAQPYYFHSVPMPKHYVPRRPLEKAINRELVCTDREARTSVITVTGIGGTGKTTLAQRVVEETFRRAEGYYGLFWFSFNQVGIEGVTALFEALSKYVGRTDLHEAWRDEPHRAKSDLLNHLSQFGYLVVVDGLEAVQVQNPSDPQFGEVKDRLLGDFLVGACSMRQSKLLLISRIAPMDVVHSAGSASVTIGEYTRSQALSYLRNSGTEGSTDELKSVALHFACHPLSLSIVAEYIRRFYRGDAASFAVDFVAGSENPISEKLGRVLENYWAHLTHIQKTLLTMMSALDRVPSSEDITMLGDILAHLAGVSRLSQPIRSELVALADMGFIMLSNGRADEVNFSIHPVLQSLILNTLSTGDEKSQAATAWALIENYRAERLRANTPLELDARAREVEYLLEAGRVNQAIGVFVGQRLNVRLFEAGRHDLGIPLGERIFALATKYGINRPGADYLSGYLPDHYASAGRIRSAVRIMKAVPLDDHWTALSDQIWILLRAGEYKSARRIIEGAPEWRRKSSYDWVEAQLTHYEGKSSCLAHFDAVVRQERNLLPSYRIRLKTQFARALLDFGNLDQASLTIADITPLATDSSNPYPSEQLHVELVRALIAESHGDIAQALDRIAVALKVSQATGDYYGALCALLQQSRIRAGLSPTFNIAHPDSASLDLSDLQEALQILRSTGEGESNYGFPIEGVQVHLILAAHAVRLGDNVGVKYHLSQSEELYSFSDHYWSGISIRNLRYDVSVTHSSEFQ